MLPLAKGCHVCSRELGFGVIEAQEGCMFTIQWDNGQSCKLSQEQIEKELEVLNFDDLPEVRSCKVYEVDFSRKKLVGTTTYIYDVEEK